ncbi:hypothetical protein BOTBODRAFT_174744 [Botryobasidium botryosum FD-172 SS1]|uniref:Cyclin N-terminal domain-containing protein n=1 Tax=Botryobasidium botryosum (strain FD-172 SS1) TaxID=930990 RepID=A0A067MFI9_BOTB1|nr:hypothetical protein BOTBODRAFT_174744 [Botryobasidium botryosum FD-172 SS1]
MSFLRLQPSDYSIFTDEPRPLTPTDAREAVDIIKSAAQTRISQRPLIYICDVIKACIVAGLPEGDALHSASSLHVYRNLFAQPYNIAYDNLQPLDTFIARLLATSCVSTAAVIAALVLMERLVGEIESHVHEYGSATGHCVFLACLIIATKSVSDHWKKMDVWQCATGVIFDKAQIRDMERRVLRSLDYDVILTTEELLVHAKNIMHLKEGRSLSTMPNQLRSFHTSSEISQEAPSTPDLWRDRSTSPTDSDAPSTPPSLHQQLTVDPRCLDLRTVFDDIELEDLHCSLASGVRSVQNRSGTRKRRRHESSPVLPVAFRPKSNATPLKLILRKALENQPPSSSRFRGLLSPVYPTASSSLGSLSTSGWVDSLFRRKRAKV